MTNQTQNISVKKLQDVIENFKDFHSSNLSVIDIANDNFAEELGYKYISCEANLTQAQTARQLFQIINSMITLFDRIMGIISVNDVDNNTKLDTLNSIIFQFDSDLYLIKEVCDPAIKLIGKLSEVLTETTYIDLKNTINLILTYVTQLKEDLNKVKQNTQSND